MSFHYIGKGLQADAFTSYVQRYQFGMIPPNYVVLHHSQQPAASWAPAGSYLWDAYEDGLDTAAIYAKRRRQLASLKQTYREVYGRDRGPHLFIDDRWIWLFTPLREIGMQGAPASNCYYQAGRLNYAISIVVIGCYDQTPWPAPVRELVAHAVCALHAHLGTFELVARRGAGGISAHRDYDAATSCPGAAISSESYLAAFADYWQRMQQPRQYRVIQGIDFAAVRQQPSHASPVAWKGKALLSPGTVIQVNTITRGQPPAESEQWAYWSPGGFIPLVYLERIGN